MRADDPRHGSNKGYAAHLADGEPTCGPCRRAHARAVRRWEYVVRHKGGNLSVPAVGTHRRIQALQRLGWTQDMIAVEAGWTDGSQIRDVLTRARVYVTTYKRIADAYERLAMRLPEPSRWVTRTQRKAERNGWPPPLAWDCIDDPAETPKGLARPRGEKLGNNHVDPVVVERVLAGEVLDTTRAEKAEIVRRWVAGGRSELSLCKRLGWKPGRYVAAREAS